MVHAVGGTPQYEHSRTSIQKFSDNLKLPTPCSSEVLSVESMIFQNYIKPKINVDNFDQASRKIQRANFLFPIKEKLNSFILQNKETKTSSTNNLAITANTDQQIRSLDFQPIPAINSINLEQAACERKKVA